MAKIISKWKIKRNAYWTVYNTNAFPTEYISSLIKPSFFFDTETIPKLRIIQGDDLECSECGSSMWFRPQHLNIPEECEEDPDIQSAEDYLFSCPSPVFCPRCGAQMIFVEV